MINKRNQLYYDYIVDRNKEKEKNGSSSEIKQPT